MVTNNNTMKIYTEWMVQTNNTMKIYTEWNGNKYTHIAAAFQRPAWLSGLSPSDLGFALSSPHRTCLSSSLPKACGLTGIAPPV